MQSIIKIPVLKMFGCAPSSDRDFGEMEISSDSDNPSYVSIRSNHGAEISVSWVDLMSAMDRVHFG